MCCKVAIVIQPGQVCSLHAEAEKKGDGGKRENHQKYHEEKRIQKNKIRLLAAILTNVAA